LTWARCFLPQSGQVKVAQCSLAAPSAASSSAYWISSKDDAAAWASAGRTSAGLIATLAVPAIGLCLGHDRRLGLRVACPRVAAFTDGVFAMNLSKLFVVAAEDRLGG
jgi:hypothetical protein